MSGLYSPKPATPVTTGGALAAGLALSPSNGIHYGTDIQIDASAPTGIYYVLFLQGIKSGLPTDGAFPAGVTLLRAPFAIDHANGTPSSTSFNDRDGGLQFTAGLCVVLSTTQFTKTGSAYALIDSVVG